MKIRRVALILAAILLLGGLALHLVHHKEPMYQGKALTTWLREYEADRTSAGQARCRQAVSAIGTNAIPILLKLLNAKGVPGGANLQAVIEGLGWTTFHAFDATYKRRLAAIGFEILGQTAKSATPKLVELARTGHSPLTRQYALWCLEEMNSDKQILVPLLTEMLHDSNQDIANFAAEQLYRLAPEDAQKAGAGKLLPFLNSRATNAPVPKQ